MSLFSTPKLGRTLANALAVTVASPDGFQLSSDVVTNGAGVLSSHAAAEEYKYCSGVGDSQAFTGLL